MFRRSLAILRPCFFVEFFRGGFCVPLSAHSYIHPDWISGLEENVPPPLPPLLGGFQTPQNGSFMHFLGPSTPNPHSAHLPPAWSKFLALLFILFFLNPSTPHFSLVFLVSICGSLFAWFGLLKLKSAVFLLIFRFPGTFPPPLVKPSAVSSRILSA